MLEIMDLHAAVDGKQVLQGVNLKIGPGELHAVMGPNGSGKSTLAYVLSGRDGYDIERGDIIYDGKSLLELAPEKRAEEGIFLAFQYPVEIPGVSNATFLRTAGNCVRAARGQEEFSATQFLKEVRMKLKALEMTEEVLSRQVNVGFSGGEKKRNEVLQMAMLEPRFAVLDETDSGLDIDALKIVADGVNKLRRSDPSILIITHYQRLLDYIVPDKVHVLAKGRIVRSGGKELAVELEEKGYSEFSGAAL